jgi:hypothetical protein
MLAASTTRFSMPAAVSRRCSQNPSYPRLRKPTRTALAYRDFPTAFWQPQSAPEQGNRIRNFVARERDSDSAGKLEIGFRVLGWTDFEIALPRSMTLVLAMRFGTIWLSF